MQKTVLIQFFSHNNLGDLPRWTQARPPYKLHGKMRSRIADNLPSSLVENLIFKYLDLTHLVTIKNSQNIGGKQHNFNLK